MAKTTIIGIKDNGREILVPNQFTPAAFSLSPSWLDLTVSQVINTQSMLNLGLWLTLSPNTNLAIKIKCYTSPVTDDSALEYADGHSLFSIKTINGFSNFTEQTYNIYLTDSQKAVIQIPTSDLVSNVKIFVRGAGIVLEASVTSQARNFK